MSSKSNLIGGQRAWAARSGVSVDERGYVNSIADNLYRPLSSRALQAFSSGSGSELQDTAQRSAKMKALHSSAALVVNFFDYWTTRNAEVLLRSLGLPENPSSIEFEAQFPTGLPGIPPNLDLALRFDSGLVIGVESKFSEWLTPKPAGKEMFKAKYFPESIGLWTSRRLPGCQALANEVQSGADQFRYLDVAQLLKHALGLSTQHPGSIELFYVFFDIPGQESLAHRAEVERFESAVKGDFRFRWSSYQDIFKKLAQSAGAEHRSYITYLGERYFPDLSQ